MQLDPEILYVQKLQYFTLLGLCTLFITAITIILLNWELAIIVFLLGIVGSYMAMVLRKDFKTPDKKAIARRMAREITKDTSPKIVARFASQLHYYLHNTQHALFLLRKYLPENSPLIYVTVADILQKKGHSHLALNILKNNPFSNTDAILLASQGNLLKEMGNYAESIELYERCLIVAEERGFPDNGARKLTQWFTRLSYLAFIHHTLADCYNKVDNHPAARRHYFSGNIRFFDLTFWKLS